MFLGGIEVIVPIHSEAVFEPSQDSDFILEKSPSSTYELKKKKSTIYSIVSYEFCFRFSRLFTTIERFVVSTAMENRTTHTVLC